MYFPFPKYLFILVLIVPFHSMGQTLVKENAISDSLVNVSSGWHLWCDVDGDGDKDVLISGVSENGPLTSLYLNQDGLSLVEGVFPDIPLKNSFLLWTDTDNDNDADLFISGLQENGNNLVPKAYLILNHDGLFEISPQEFDGVYSAEAVSTDFDNDGLADLCYTGDTTYNNGIFRIYRNHGNNTFSQVDCPLDNLFSGSLAYTDRDGDMDADILVSGIISDLLGSQIKIFRLFDNEGDFQFTGKFMELEPFSNGSLAISDYDSDGFADVLASGSPAGPTNIAWVYQNFNGQQFQNIGIEIFGAVDGSATWSDYDLDGDPDFLITGLTSYSSKPVATLYRNIGGGLFNVDEDFAVSGLMNGNACWTDLDGDNDPDLSIVGASDISGLNPVSYVYRNESPSINNPPSEPSGLTAEVNENEVVFKWEPSSDDHTPSAGLTYNLRIGSSPGGCDILSPLSDANGKRMLLSHGNAYNNLSWKIRGLQAGTYFWSVQAIDHCFSGSAFASEKFFEVGSITANIEKTLKEQCLTVYPNPAGSVITVIFYLTKETHATIAIYDVSADRPFRELTGFFYQGMNRMVWNRTKPSGEIAQKGIYFVVLETPGRKEVVKLLLF